MGKHRVAKAKRAQTLVAGALTSGTLITGGIGHTPQAAATCLSISGVDFGSGCKSAPLSVAIGLGPHASARAVKPWTVAFGTTVKPSVSPWGGDPFKAVDEALVHAVRTLMPWLGAGSRRADAHHTAEETAAKKKTDEDAAKLRKKAEDDAEAIRQKADDDAAAVKKKADDDAAAVKTKADEDAAALKAKTDAAAAAAAIKQKADDDAAAVRKKADDDAAAIKQKADEDAGAIRKKADDDAAAVRKKADDDAAEKDNPDEESLVKAEARLREINDAASREYNLSEKNKEAARVERDALAPNDPRRAEKEIAFDKADVAAKRALRKYSESGRLVYAAQQKYEAFRKIADADDSSTVTESDVAAKKAALDEAKNALRTIQAQRNREFSEFEAAVQELEALGGNDPRRAEARAKVLKTAIAETNSRETYDAADLAAFTAQTEYDATKKAADLVVKKTDALLAETRAGEDATIHELAEDAEAWKAARQKAKEAADAAVQKAADIADELKKAERERDALAADDPLRASKEEDVDFALDDHIRARTKEGEAASSSARAAAKYEAAKKIAADAAANSKTVSDSVISAKKAAFDRARESFSKVKAQRIKALNDLDAAIDKLLNSKDDTHRAERRANVLSAADAELKSRSAFDEADVADFKAEAEYEAAKKASEAATKRPAGNASGPQAASRIPESRSERVVHAEEPVWVSSPSGMVVNPDPDAPSPTDEYADSADSGSTNDVVAPKELQAKSTVTAGTPERIATEKSEIFEHNGSDVDDGDRAVSNRADTSGRSVKNVPSTEATHPKTSPSPAKTPETHADGTGDTGLEAGSNTVSGSEPEAKQTSDAGTSTDSPAAPKS